MTTTPRPASTPLTRVSEPAEGGVSAWAEHTAYSDPGRYAALLADVPTDPDALSAVARNVIVHYRHSGHELPETSRDDINARWLARILELDQGRHGLSLAAQRTPSERVQGCCRDHALFCCAVLRQHGIPARGRIGFAGYFEDGDHVDYWHDHVVVETWTQDGSGGRWRRFDPEVTPADGLLDSPMDMPTGPTSPFVTAAEAWRGWRAGELDHTRFGPGPGVVPEGPWFLQNYVLREAAHRHGDELLLWDVWGAMAGPDAPIDDQVLALTDEVAALLVAADAEQAHRAGGSTAPVVGGSAGDGPAGEGPAGEGPAVRLARRYAGDPRLRPGRTVLRFDPFAGPDDEPTPVDLTLHP